MTEYSLNLRTLVENYDPTMSLGGSPNKKQKKLNPTQLKIEEIKDNLRRFAEFYYTKEELHKAYPVNDSNATIKKLHAQMLEGLEVNKKY